MRNPFKPTLSKRIKRAVTTTQPVLQNVAAAAVLVSVAAPVLAPVGSFLAAMVGNLRGHAENVVSDVGARFKGRKAA